MFADFTFATILDVALFLSCLFLLSGSLYISYKTKFIQLSLLPRLVKTFVQSFSLKTSEDNNTILPHKALFTAMSTTLGVTTIAGPAIAISLGGPGALLGFLLTSVLGSAATFTEVSLCVKFRTFLKSGEVVGGPMGYLSKLLSPAMARWYAISCCILMTAWSSAQANQLAAIFNSPLMGNYKIPPTFSGLLIAILVYISLQGGIKRVSTISSKLVPLMFVLFLGSSFWIILANITLLPTILKTIVYSAFEPFAMSNGVLVGGVVTALRWGMMKGTQTTEAGIGTQTIPHSLTNSDDAFAQATLSMISTYTAGFVAFLSGCVILITNTWQDPGLPVGISMIAASFHMYFSNIGLGIVAFCTFLFAFGTILGNSYNGSQCFAYLREMKQMNYYFIFCTCMIFGGAISEVTTLWSTIDIFLVAMALPHMYALLKYTYQGSFVKETALVQSEG